MAKLKEYHMPRSRIDKEALLAQCRGRWRGILMQLGIGAEFLAGKHTHCPKCAGKDRFRPFSDFDETGGVICSQCHSQKNGDGLSTVMWW